MVDNNNKDRQSYGFFDRLTGVILGAIVESIDFLVAAIEHTLGILWDGFADGMVFSWKKLVEYISPQLRSSTNKRWKSLIDYLSRYKAIDSETIDDFNKLKDLSEPMEWFTWIGIWIATIGVTVKGFVYAVTGDIRRKQFSQYEPENMDVNSALRAAFIAPEKIELVKRILEEAGLPDDQIELMFISMYRVYDEGIVRGLFLRGEIDETKMFERMKQLGYTDTRINEIVKLWQVIPGVQDIVRYIAKEAFEPDKIKTFGLMEEYPVEAEKWAKMQGVSKKWVEAEWVAHWRDLGIDFMLEAFHRHIVDWDLVKDYMSLIEIPPKLQSIVRDTAFRVYTRVDVRRMHAMGVLNDAELVTAYLDQGYDEDKAVKMAEFTIQYNIQQQKDLTKSEILKGYAERIIPKEEAKDMLVDMKYDSDEAEYLLTFEDYKENKKLEDLVLKNIATRFQSNLISEFETRSRLAKLNLSGERIDLLVEKWQIDITVDIKPASKADSDKFYAGGLIDKDNYRDRLKKIGYLDKDIDLYIKLIEQAKAKV